MSAGEGIPSELVREVINEWKKRYGPTFPLYGRETVRNDISGSVRPLLASTEMAHENILAEISGISKRKITRIMEGAVEFVTIEDAEDLAMAMNVPDVWWNEWADYYS